MSRVHPEDAPRIERLKRKTSLLSNALAATALAGVLTGSTTTGAVPISPVDTYTGPDVIAVSPTLTPTPSAETTPSATPTTRTTSPKPVDPNASCRPGVPKSVDWEVMGIDGSPIELFGLDPKTGGLAKTEDRFSFGIYKGGPQIGSRQGNVLTGGERYHTEGESIFPPDYQQRLASEAVNSVVTFHMKDGGTCSYKIDMTLPAVDKFNGAYPEAVKQYNLYRRNGTPGIEIEGCTGPFNRKEGTSQFTGIAVGHLMTAEDS